MEWPDGAPHAMIMSEKPTGRYVPRKPGHQLYRSNSSEAKFYVVLTEGGTAYGCDAAD